MQVVPEFDGKGHKKGFKVNWNFLGVCKERSPELIGMEEKHTQMYWSHVSWCCTEFLVVEVVLASTTEF
jgi:hypothetical protein